MQKTRTLPSNFLYDINKEERFMNCCIMSNLERYLRRFDEVLEQMANQMLCRTSLGDVTIDFCECMIPHHQAAIYMCKNVLQYTQNEDLRGICNQIIETQQEEICQMEEIKNSTCGFVNTLSDTNIYISQYLNITRNMICRMRNSPQCCCVNLSFINEMIPHHEGAICMCENVLQCCIDPRLREMCERIIAEQTEGVRRLKQIRCMICNG